MHVNDHTTLLPSELLHTIFALLPGRHHTLTLLRKVPSWISVSHVCRRWRGIALKCRALWTRSPFPNLAWAEEAIVRSSPALLDVFLDAAFHSEALAELALRDLSRIGTLHLSLAAMSLSGQLPVVIANAKTESYILPACGRGPMQNLEELEIVAVNDHDGLTRELLRIPAAILGGTVPTRLRRLTLEGCALPTRSCLLRAQLTFLTLSSSKAWTDLDEMRSSLMCMPHLETLIIRVDCVIGTKPDVIIDIEHPRIDLERMRVLDLWSSCLDDACLLLDNVRINMDASITIVSRDSLGASVRSVKHIAATIQDLMDTRRGGHVVYGHATVSIPGPWFTYAGIQNPQVLLASEQAGTIRIGRDIYHKGGLSITVAQSEDDGSANYGRFRDLLRLPAISTCRMLTVRDLEDLSSPAYWIDLFLDFNQVIELDLIRRASLSFSTFMNSTDYFPLLRILWISEVSITKREEDMPGFDRSLREGILKRVASGKLKKIRIFRCDVAAEYVRQLTEQVGDGMIEWDGHEWGWQEAQRLDTESSSIDEFSSNSSDESSEDA
ncbi:unnamed protein product [Peniophora sp. CBMAI 1063]|nr:unnamed protein product [Peniophora sp. CBMAI 1063]